MSFIDNILGRRKQPKAPEWFKAWEAINQERHRQIMATQQEIIDKLKAQAVTLVTLGTKVEATTSQVNKVATETATLKTKIQELQEAIENQTGASPELLAAAEAVDAQLAILDTQVNATKSAAQAADDAVPDAEPTP